MAKLPVPFGFDVAVKMSLGDDSDVLNIFHGTAAIAGPYAAGDLIEIATGFFTVYRDTFLTELSQDVTLHSATAKDLTTTLGAQATFVGPGTDVGGKAHASAPANVAVAVSWKEGISYRGGHPRTYLGGIASDEFSDPQHIVAVDAANIQAQANLFMTGVNALTGTSSMFPVIFAVVHYSLHKVLQTPPITEAITAALVNTRLDSQRRRLQG